MESTTKKFIRMQGNPGKDPSRTVEVQSFDPERLNIPQGIRAFQLSIKTYVTLRDGRTFERVDYESPVYTLVRPNDDGMKG